MKTALQKFRSPRWRVKHGVKSLKATAAEASEYGCCALVHNVIKNDEDNQPQTDVARISIAPEIEEVEQIPWAEWLKAYFTADLYDEFLARSAFEHALLWLHRHAHACNLATDSPIETDRTDRPYPIAMQKLKGHTLVVAMDEINKGHLVIPVFCRRDSSYLITRTSSKNGRSNMEVTGIDKWKETGDGTHDRLVEVCMYCQPERRQPAAKGRLKASDYDQSMDCHPFWHIRRSSCVTEFNCEMVWVAITTITSSSMKELTTKGNTPKSAVRDFAVLVPCIRNTARIESGKELVLKWEKKANKKRRREEKESSVHSASKLQAPRRAECKESLRTGCWGSAG